MGKPREGRIRDLLRDGPAVDEAMARAFSSAVEVHRAAGVAMVIGGENGEPVLVDPWKVETFAEARKRRRPA